MTSRKNKAAIAAEASAFPVDVVNDLEQLETSLRRTPKHLDLVRVTATAALLTVGAKAVGLL